MRHPDERARRRWLVAAVLGATLLASGCAAEQDGTGRPGDTEPVSDQSELAPGGDAVPDADGPDGGPASDDGAGQGTGTECGELLNEPCHDDTFSPCPPPPETCDEEPCTPPGDDACDASEPSDPSTEESTSEGDAGESGSGESGSGESGSGESGSGESTG
jgi:hypothetical protein